MRAPTGVDKENVAPFAPGSPGSSPLKATPSRSQRISWSHANQHHPYSDSVKNIPSSGKAKDPARSILKKNVHIVPMQPLQPEPTPEPENVINDEQYILSPVRTIAESANDGSGISDADLREAYNLLAARVRIKVHPDKVLASFPVFKPLHTYHTQLAVALERDLARCFRDPLSPPSTSTQSYATDVFSASDIPMSSSPVREGKRRGMTDGEIRYARDLYSVCHGALRLLSNVFAIPQLCTIFDEDELNTLLTALLAIPLASEIPTPNSRKTYALAIFVLQTQRLPMDVVEPAKPRITYAFSRAIEGELGKEGKKGAATDALKAVAEHLQSEPAEFLDCFVDLLPSILQSVLSPNASIRTQCVHAFGAFVMAKTSINVEEPGNDKYRDTFDIVSQQVGSYVDKLHDARKNPKDADMLSKALKITLSSEALENKVTGPIWGACTLATIIVLSGGQLFKRQNALKMVIGCMPFLTKHKLAPVKAIGRLVWRCLVWAFTDLQQSVDRLEDGQHKREQLASCDAAWKIVRQVVDGSVGLAMVIAVLCDRTMRGIRRALDVVQTMLAGSSKSHQFATEILQQLTSGATNRDAKHECALNPENALLYAGLFDGNLMTFEQNVLAATLQKVVKLVEVKAVRALTDEELISSWPALYTLWKTSLFQTELDEGKNVPAMLLDIWRNLLVAKTMGDDEHVEPDNATQHRVLAVFRECISKQDQPEVKPEQRMYICRQLWRVVREVCGAEVCANISRALLDEIIEFDLASEEDEVVQPWAEFSAGLLVVSTQDALYAWMSSTEMDLDVKRHLWVALGREWNSDGASSYDGAVYLLSCPFRAWALLPEEWDVWDGIVSTAVQRGARCYIAANAVLDRVCGLIGSEEDDYLTMSEVVRHLLGAVVVTGDDDEPVPTGIFTVIGHVLEQKYPPPRVELDCLTDLLRDLCDFVQSMPSSMIIPFLDATLEGLCLWNQDAKRALTDRQYGREIVPLYQYCLDSLTNVKMTVARLETYATFLASTFHRISLGAEGPAALLRFWQHILREVPDVRERCPDALIPCLKSLAETWGADLGVSVSLSHEHDSVNPDADAAMLVEKSQDSEALPEVSLALHDDDIEDDSWDAVEECTASSREPSQREVTASEIESEDDEQDWVHKTPSPAPLFMGEVDMSDEDSADRIGHPSTSNIAPHPHSSPRTPPRQMPSSSKGDVAFFLDSGASNSVVPSSVPLQDYARTWYAPAHAATPSMSLSSRSVLGKRQRGAEPLLDGGVRTVLRDRGSDTDSSEEDDSIVEESLVLEGAPHERRRISSRLHAEVHESPDTASPISSCSSSSSRKKRVLDAVELPRLGAEEKGQHVLMSSLMRAFLPLASAVP